MHGEAMPGVHGDLLQDPPLRLGQHQIVPVGACFHALRQFAHARRGGPAGAVQFGRVGLCAEPRRDAGDAAGAEAVLPGQVVEGRGQLVASLAQGLAPEAALLGHVGTLDHKGLAIQRDGRR